MKGAFAPSGLAKDSAFGDDRVAVALRFGFALRSRAAIRNFVFYACKVVAFYAKLNSSVIPVARVAGEALAAAAFISCASFGKSAAGCVSESVHFRSPVIRLRLNREAILN